MSEHTHTWTPVPDEIGLYACTCGAHGRRIATRQELWDVQRTDPDARFGDIRERVAVYFRTPVFHGELANLGDRAEFHLTRREIRRGRAFDPDERRP